MNILANSIDVVVEAKAKQIFWEHVIFAMSNYTQKLHNSCEPISPLR
jgi:hypothetical protein